MIYAHEYIAPCLWSYIISCHCFRGIDFPCSPGLLHRYEPCMIWVKPVSATPKQKHKRMYYSWEVHESMNDSWNLPPFSGNKFPLVGVSVPLSWNIGSFYSVPFSLPAGVRVVLFNRHWPMLGVLIYVLKNDGVHGKLLTILQVLLTTTKLLSIYTYSYNVLPHWRQVVVTDK